MEIWKPVLGFEELYEISNLGNCRRIKRGKKFSAEDIVMAKNMFASGAKLKEVAAFLNTSITTVMSIKHGKTWNGDEHTRPLIPIAGTDQYFIFSFCKDGKYKRTMVHRAVWEAFNGPIPGRLEVNHINLDRQDNRLENLELLTHQENCQHAQSIYKAEGNYRNGRYKEHNTARKNKSIKHLQYEPT